MSWTHSFPLHPNESDGMHKKLSTIADIDTEVSHDKWLTGEAMEEGGMVAAEQDEEMGYMLDKEDEFAF